MIMAIACTKNAYDKMASKFQQNLIRYAVPIGAVVIVIGLFFISQTHSSQFKCPEAYKSDADKMQAFLAWGEDFVKANPKAKGDLGAYDTARTDFLIGQHCTATLKNFGYDGVSPIDATVRQEIIAVMVKNDTGSSTESNQ